MNHSLNPPHASAVSETPAASLTDILAQLTHTLESRKVANGGDPQSSYVARLLSKGPDAFLKKIGEEATEVVMAAKDMDVGGKGGDSTKLVGEVADLWFHSMIALTHYGLTAADVLAELQRRVGVSGLDEKALRKMTARAHDEGQMRQDMNRPMPLESHAPDCIFCKIVRGQIPSKKLYEDDEILAFHDIAPWAPVHFLVIPKQHVASMAQLTGTHSNLMGRIMTLIPQLALQAGCLPYPQGGYRVIVNTGEHGGQEVHHLHIHVMGGPRPWHKG